MDNEANGIVFAIGLTAGTLVALSTIPQIVTNWKDPSTTRFQSARRNALQLAGNTLWIIYGVCLLAWPLIIFATLSVILTGILIFQQFVAAIRARAAKHEDQSRIATIGEDRAEGPPGAKQKDLQDA